MLLQRIKQWVSGAVCVTVSLAGLTLLFAEQCYEPSSSTEFCTDQPAMGVCKGQTSGECEFFRHRNRNKFPIGRDESEEGVTTEEEEECYQEAVCEWSPDEKECVPGDYGAWHPGDKIVPDPDVECPSG